MHCAEHNTDEPIVRPVIRCGECWHRYASWAEVWRCYVGEFYAMWWRAWVNRWDLPRARMLFTVPFQRPSRLLWCPHCTHDF